MHRHTLSVSLFKASITNQIHSSKHLHKWFYDLEMLEMYEIDLQHLSTPSVFNLLPSGVVVQLLCHIMEVQCFIWILIDGRHSKMQIPSGAELKRTRSPSILDVLPALRHHWCCPILHGEVSLSILFDGFVVFLLAYFCLL